MGRGRSFKILCGLTVLAATLPQVAPGVAQTDPGVRYDTRNGYTLAFVDADVRRVVDAVLGSMLKADYSVDPGVQGNITLRTRQPVARESLLPLLESALRSVGAVILVDGSTYRVVKRDDAGRRAPIAPQSAEAGPPVAGYATEVVTIRKGSAREIGRLLEQFLGKDILGGVDAAQNQVIVRGSAEERKAARDLIARFDVDSLAAMTFEMIRLDNVDADTLVAELERIFQPPYDIIGSRIRIVPLPRLRSVLAIAADRSDIARVEPWIRRLDAGVAGKRRLYNYAVQNGRARDLAISLQLVLGVGGGGQQPGPGGIGNSPVPPVTALGSGGGGRDGPATPSILSSPAPIRSRQDGPASSEPMPMQPGATAGPRIVPNEANNSLLIYADGEEYEFIREAIGKLDQPVAQVLIEATLAEVTLTDDLRYGVNFRAVSGNFTGINNNAQTPGPSAVFPGFSASLVNSSVNAILNTLQSKTNVRVLSAPKLIVLNNQTATLQVGDQVPIITQQQQSVSAPGAPLVNTIELRDTGVILNVTPRVNDSGTITLDIAQEVSEVANTTTAGINSPTIQQRRISSAVATRSGQMVALGGLIRDRSSRGKSGFPLLSQIPVVGGLFGSHNNTGTRTELIILLTPTVIRSPDEVRGIVDTLIDGLDSTRPLIDRAVSKQVGGKRNDGLPPRP